jgi:hypothetical protein
MKIISFIENEQLDKKVFKTAADPNLPNCSIPRQKINVDNKARFRYLNTEFIKIGIFKDGTRLK